MVGKGVGDLEWCSREQSISVVDSLITNKTKRFYLIEPAPNVPPPTLWKADPDGWRLYAEIDIEPVSKLTDE